MVDKFALYWEWFLALAERNPEFAAALVAFVVWPTITAVASFGFERFEQRFPFAVGLLRANGLDLARFLDLVRKHWPKRLPPPPPSAVLFLVATLAFLTGCGAGADLAKVVEAGRDVAAFAEPCAVAAQDVAIARCESDECRRQVVDKFAPIADALDVLHDGWCALAPESEGCP